MRYFLPILVLFCSVSQVAGESPTKSLTDEVESAVIKKTNQFRADHHLSKLKKNNELNAEASKFAKFMAETGKYGHHADGNSPAERAEAGGYEYCVVRENIAYRTNTGEITAASLIEVFMQGWIDSPPHRENMLAKYVTDTGVAIATTDEITYYAVAVFGRPESASIKLTITNESEQVQTLVVETNGNKDEIEVPAGAGVTMTRCFPTKLSLKGRDERVKLDKSTDLVIDGDAIKQKPSASNPPVEPTQ